MRTAQEEGYWYGGKKGRNHQWKRARRSESARLYTPVSVRAPAIGGPYGLQHRGVASQKGDVTPQASSDSVHGATRRPPPTSAPQPLEPSTANNVAAARAEWAKDQAELDPERLVFIDETGTSTNMARLRGRAPRG